MRPSWSTSIWPRSLTARPAASRFSPSVFGFRPIGQQYDIGFDHLRIAALRGFDGDERLFALPLDAVDLRAGFQLQALLFQDAGEGLGDFRRPGRA